MVSYKVLCNADVSKEISVHDLLENEKILKAIKNEYAKGLRNVNILCASKESVIKIETLKDVHSFEAEKDDYADLLVLAEEDASNKKLIKKDCDRVELVDIETVDLVKKKSV